MKLWKVRVNNWGWDSPKELFGASRSECEQYADKFPAADAVEYAGNFGDEKAEEILTTTREYIKYYT